MHRLKGTVLVWAVVLLALIGLAGLIAQPSARAAYPVDASSPAVGTPPGSWEAIHPRISGVVLWPPERMAREGGTGGGPAGPLNPPNFGANVDASLNNASNQNETTIAINPENSQVVIASGNDYRCNLCPEVYRSTNGGTSWVNYPVPSVGNLFYGDPAMAFGTSGSAYFTYLGYTSLCAGQGGMYVSRSTDAGATFSQPLQLAANNNNGPAVVFHDKEYVAVDNYPTSPYSNTVYAAWTKYVFQNGATCGSITSTITAPAVLARSTDRGLTWSTPITVTPPYSDNVGGVVPAVGHNGEVYVYALGAQSPIQPYVDTVLFARSTDGGQTFPFFTHIAGIVDLPSPLPPTSFRNNAYGSIAVDGQLDGYLYAVWADYGTGDADIHLSRSTDNGTTWGAPQRLNDDPPGNGKDQFFPWIAASPDGRVHVVWYDRRDDPQNRNFHAYYTASKNHGATWEPNVRVSTAPSAPGGSTFIGDYNGIAATSDLVLPIWTDIRTGSNQNAYVALGTYGGTATPGATATATVPPTATAPPVLTPSPSATPTAVPCTISFTDVPSSQPFYPFIRWMACRGYISGYNCGGPGEPCDPQNRPYFRPGNNVTRGQLMKMVVNAAGFPIVNPAPNYTFTDVPVSHPFYPFIETGVARGLISGYNCGGPNEPCDPQQRPYFRPNADITRGQLAKIIALARGYTDPAPAIATFNDVPPSHPFFLFIEQVAAHNVVSGYTCDATVINPCTGLAEQCPGPYFRPCNPATRGQVTKMVTVAYGGP